MNKEDNLKEKFKQALISTVKVISDDYKLEKEVNKNLSSKNYNFFELDNLNTKQDYVKLRAETDSEALKRKFSNIKIYQKNLPKNSSCKFLLPESLSFFHLSGYILAKSPGISPANKELRAYWVAVGKIL